jgi:hypothetical protein
MDVRRWAFIVDRRPTPKMASTEATKRTEQEDYKLVATEEAGAQARRQIRPIAPRTHQAVQPALGQMRIGQMRIGFVAHHR